MPNVDYELTRTELNFNPDDDIDCFNITVINDDVIEDQNNEMFSISLSVQTDDNYTFIGAQMATFRIMDDAEGKWIPLLQYCDESCVLLIKQGYTSVY